MEENATNIISSLSSVISTGNKISQSPMIDKEEMQKFFVEHGTTLAEVKAANIPPITWAVQDLIPAGAILIAAPAKSAKSMFCLNLCLAIAEGGDAFGKIPVEQGECLYLSLEAGTDQGWFQDNVNKIDPSISDDVIKNIHLFFEWPDADNKGIDLLRGWLSQHPKCRLVVIDVYDEIKGKRKTSGSPLLK